MVGFSYIEGMENDNYNQGTKADDDGRAGDPDFDPMFVVVSTSEER